jgi:hypothetical protein
MNTGVSSQAPLRPVLPLALGRSLSCLLCVQTLQPQFQTKLRMQRVRALHPPELVAGRVAALCLVALTESQHPSKSKQQQA